MELKDYYKFVKVCKLCKKEYGLDKNKEKRGKDICPICLVKLRKKV